MDERMGRITGIGIVLEWPRLDIDGNEAKKPFATLAGVPGYDGLFVVGNITVEKLLRLSEELNSVLPFAEPPPADDLDD